MQFWGTWRCSRHQTLLTSTSWTWMGWGNCWSWRKPASTLPHLPSLFLSKPPSQQHPKLPSQPAPTARRSLSSSKPTARPRAQYLLTLWTSDKHVHSVRLILSSYLSARLYHKLSVEDSCPTGQEPEPHKIVSWEVCLASVDCRPEHGVFQTIRPTVPCNCIKLLIAMSCWHMPAPDRLRPAQARVWSSPVRRWPPVSRTRPPWCRWAGAWWLKVRHLPLTCNSTPSSCSSNNSFNNTSRSVNLFDWQPFLRHHLWQNQSNSVREAWEVLRRKVSCFMHGLTAMMCLIM